MTACIHTTCLYSPTRVSPRGPRNVRCFQSNIEWETETGKTRVAGGGAEVPGWPEIPAGLDVISVDVSSDSIPYYNT
jgi:hypothetical protein